ncbi:hypothetical protein Tco_0997266 [Tanacetum coccineum]
MSMGSLKRAFGHGKTEHELTTQSDPILQAGNPVNEVIKCFQDEVKYEHVGPKVPSSQEGERSQDDEEMIYD